LCVFQKNKFIVCVTIIVCRHSRAQTNEYLVMWIFIYFFGTHFQISTWSRCATIQFSVLKSVPIWQFAHLETLILISKLLIRIPCRVTRRVAPMQPTDMWFFRKTQTSLYTTTYYVFKVPTILIGHYSLTSILLPVNKNIIVVTRHNNTF